MALVEPSPLTLDIPRPAAPEPPSPATPSPLTHVPFLPTAFSPPPSRPASPPLLAAPHDVEHTPALTPSTSTPASTAPGTPATSPPPSTSACSPATSHTSLATPAGSGSDKEAEPSAAKDTDYCNTTTGTLNVKFAPLPQLAPRRRRSTAPLGMAARSALVRGRRGPAAAAAEAGMAMAVANAAEGDDEAEMISLAELRWRQEEAAARYAHFQGSAYAEMARATEVEIALEEAAREAKAMQRATKGKGTKNNSSDVDVETERVKTKVKRREYEHDAAEDPIVALGKVVKGVGRHLWRRRVSSNALRSDSPTASPVPDTAARKPVADAPLRPILATIVNSSSRPGSSSGTQSIKDSASVKEVATTTEVENNPAGNQAESADVAEIKVSVDEPKQDSQTTLSTPSQTPLADDLWAAALADDIPSDIGQTETMVGGRVVKPIVTNADGR